MSVVTLHRFEEAFSNVKPHFQQAFAAADAVPLVETESEPDYQAVRNLVLFYIEAVSSRTISRVCSRYHGINIPLDLH